MQWFWIGWMQSWHQCSTLLEFYRHVLAEPRLCGRTRDRAINRPGACWYPGSAMAAHGGIRIPLGVDLSKNLIQSRSGWKSFQEPLLAEQPLYMPGIGQQGPGP